MEQSNSASFKDGFRIWTNKVTQEIELEFPNFKSLEEVIAFTKNNNVVKLRIGDMAWKNDHLNDLQYFPKLKSVVLSCSKVKNFDGLYNVPLIEEILFSDKVIGELNVSKIPHLKKLHYCHGKQTVHGLEHKSLKYLSISNYKVSTKSKNKLPEELKVEELSFYKLNTKSTDLKDLSACANLKKLAIHGSNITSLEGINNYNSLEAVSFNGLGKLIDIKELGALEKIVTIEIQNASSIQNFTALGNCKLLKQLTLDGVGTIEDVYWISKLSKLKRFVIVGSTIENNDLTPLLKNWEHLYFEDKKSYSHKLSEFLNTKTEGTRNDYESQFFGQLNLQSPDKYYESSVMLDEREISISLYFENQSLATQTVTEIDDFLSNRSKYFEKAKSAIEKDYQSKKQVFEYLEHHINELDNNILGISNNDMNELFKKIQVEKIAFHIDKNKDEFATFDFTIGRAITNYLLAVRINKAGTVTEIVMES